MERHTTGWKIFTVTVYAKFPFKRTFIVHTEIESKNELWQMVDWRAKGPPNIFARVWIWISLRWMSILIDFSIDFLFFCINLHLTNKERRRFLFFEKWFSVWNIEAKTILKADEIKHHYIVLSWWKLLIRNFVYSFYINELNDWFRSNTVQRSKWEHSILLIFSIVIRRTQNFCWIK